MQIEGVQYIGESLKHNAVAISLLPHFSQTPLGFFSIDTHTPRYSF